MFAYKSVLIAALCVLSVSSNTVPKKSAGFSVKGTTILDATGTPFIMRGVSHEHTWFKSDLETAVAGIAKTKANIVRIVLADGDQWDKDDAASVEKIISLLYDNKLIAMLEVHDATGKDDEESLEKAVDFWIGISDVLKGKEDRVIINIANEWYSKDDAKAWGDAYQTAVKKLRDAGFTHLLVIDAAGWGQYPDVISKTGPDVFAADTLKNTVFSIHMYANAGKDEKTVKSNIDNALATNIPVIVGEFGDIAFDTPVALETILSYSQEKSVGWLAWSWYGNTDGVLDMATGPDGELTAYGEKVVNGDNGLKATSKPSAIFK